MSVTMTMRWLTAAAGSAVFMGLGVGLWSMTSRESRREEIIKKLPESPPEKMDEVRKTNELIIQTLKDAAKTKSNIAATLGSSSK
ncbi:ubiquinol-cytochrome-c reductase complex assembly factor 3 [Thalassophryne amazonica]|uniref:ubiquinol-cytochrome-c reductase complex assembly factor 3 n=1 Tax=Thalassophryne amazonica TaxID=390379 RepID=UPI0014717D21|nr:ubiquinol-cytochrome-c reductase complex assembly factor 3 [Thalassophryne amazonica]